MATDIGNTIANCVQPGGNTGIGSCFNDLGVPVGAFIVPYGATYDTSSVANFLTAMQAATLNDDPLQRVYPIHELLQVTDSTPANTTQTFNSTGAMFVVREGYFNWTFQFVKGGLCLLIALRKFNGQNWNIMFYDSYGKVWTMDAGSGLGAGANPNNYWANTYKIADGTKLTEYTFTVDIEPTQFLDNMKLIDFAASGGLATLKTIVGLQNVTLVQLVARSTNVLKIGAVTSCGTVNMHNKYATQLAATGAWVATNKSTGSIIAITSVADDTTDGGWTITLNASDPNYTATAGGILISLAGPTELNGLLVKGFESNKLAQ